MPEHNHPQDTAEDRDYLLSVGRRGSGSTVHRVGCRRAGRVSGWPYMAGLTPDQVRAKLIADGENRDVYRFCRSCLPELEPLPEWEPPRCHYENCGKTQTDIVHAVDHVFIGRPLPY